LIDAKAAAQNIVAEIACQKVIAALAIYLVVAITARRTIIACVAENAIFAGVAAQVVIAAITDKPVIAVATGDDVVTAQRFNLVVASKQVDQIGLICTVERVVVCSAGDIGYEVFPVCDADARLDFQVKNPVAPLIHILLTSLSATAAVAQCLGRKINWRLA
jgi:hypothetical protein